MAVSKCPCLTFCNFMFRCQNLICSKHQLIVRSIVPPTLLAHHPAKHIQTHRTHKSHKNTYTQTTDMWAIFFQICSNLVPRVFSFFNRDLTILRRRRQRDCQKAKQQLCTCITLFCTFLCSPCTTTTWNDAILSLLGNGNGEAINSTISVRTRARSLLFSSKLSSLLLRNWTPWNNRKKECKDAKSTFQRCSHPVLMDVALVYRHDNFSRNDFALKVDALCDMDARTFFCSIFGLQVFEQASKTCNAKTRIPLMLFCVTSVVNFPGKDFC